MELRSRAGAVVGLAAVAVSLAACSPGTAAGQTYADGTYSAEGEYATPETVEKIEVTITLADNVITAVEVSGTPMRPETVRFQGQFVDGIAAEVVGVDIDKINVKRVAGSSLTSGGFNKAVDAIKAQALEQ